MKVEIPDLMTDNTTPTRRRSATMMALGIRASTRALVPGTMTALGPPRSILPRISVTTMVAGTRVRDQIKTLTSSKVLTTYL